MTIITLLQAQRLVELFGGSNAEVTIIPAAIDQAPGLYAYFADRPEDGARYLGPTETEVDDAAKSGADSPSTTEVVDLIPVPRRELQHVQDALKYWNFECSFAEPSLSLAQSMGEASINALTSWLGLPVAKDGTEQIGQTQKPQRWEERLQQNHPRSDAQHWPDALRLEYMTLEVAEWRLAAQTLAQPVKKLEAASGDVLPPIGSRVFIRHGRDKDAHPCTVTGYYAWPDLGGDLSLHRVFVRVVYEGTNTNNARLLRDCYPTEDAALNKARTAGQTAPLTHEAAISNG